MNEISPTPQPAGSPLAETIAQLASLAVALPEASLDRPWRWGSYQNEGIRFAFFRVMEELRSLAVRLYQLRAEAGQPPSQAQRILGQYHSASRELQAILLGLDSPGFEQVPAEGEWPVRRTLAHILGGDLGFWVLVRHALERHRAAAELTRLTDADYERISGLNEATYGTLMDSPAPGLLAEYTRHHARVLSQFCEISDAELELPSYYWEAETYPLRFRLHRFESHTRQHTVQIEKTLAAIGRLPAEPLRLMRLVYLALAEVESARLGDGGLGEGLAAEVSGRIAGWIEEIQNA